MIKFTFPLSKEVEIPLSTSTSSKLFFKIFYLNHQLNINWVNNNSERIMNTIVHTTACVLALPTSSDPPLHYIRNKKELQ
jgi:hypothetical protein